MHFTDIFVKRPVLATVVSLLILLAGLQAIFQLPIRQFPEVSDTKIEITTVYPGANADQIKGFITTPLQQAVASTEGVDIIESRSSQNVSTITLKLRLDADADRALADVLSKVNEVKGVLPEESNDPVVKRTTGAGFALMYISFKSEQMSAPQISDYLDRVVKPKLQAINGVASAEILGGSTFAMRVWLDPEKMASLGITPLDIRQALAANNFTTAAGEVKSDFTQQNINAQTSLETPEQFENLVVATRDGAVIRLGQVASVDLGPENYNSTSAFDGLKAAAREVGSIQIQNRGTIGGNLCNASPAADGVPPLLCLDASVELASKDQRRILPLSAFITGYRRTALRDGEIVTAVIVPKPAASAAGAFVKLGARRYLVISILMAAAVVEKDETGRIAAAAVAVGAASPVAQRLTRLEQDLLGLLPGERPSTRVAAHHLDGLSPISDVRASDAYRREAAIAVVGQALDRAAGAF